MLLQNSFMESFTEFIWERINEVLTGPAMDDKERQKWSDESEKLRGQIKALLGREHSQLFSDFQDATTARFAVDIEYAYRQGLKDGALFRTELGIEHPNRLVS
jgi:hypothetical protein